MTTERPDRGARALAQGIAIGISGEPNGLGLTWNEAVTVGHRIAGHLVGPGAFLPDAAEEAETQRLLIEDAYVRGFEHGRLPDAAELERLRTALREAIDYMPTSNVSERARRDRWEAALHPEPEGSAQG